MAAARPIRRVAVLGGGISGLTLAYYLRALPRLLTSAHRSGPGFDTHVTVIEKAPRLGGWLESVQYPPTGNTATAATATAAPAATAAASGEPALDYSFDVGARSLHAHRTPHVLALAQHLRLTGDIVRSSAAARKRFLFEARPSARLVEAAPLALLRRPPYGVSRTRMALGVLSESMAPPADTDDESVHAFAARRLRNTPLADALIDPLMAGIYAGDARRLSVRSCLRAVWDMEHVFGSLTGAVLNQRFGAGRFASYATAPHSCEWLFQPDSALLARLQDRDARTGGGGLYSFRGGMEALPRALTAALRADPGVTLVTGHAATRVRLAGDGRSGGCVLDAGPQRQDMAFDAVVSTLRADAFADALAPAATAATAAAAGADGTAADALEALRGELRGVHYASVVVAHVAYDSGDVLRAGQRGFGVLVASQQPSQALGVTFDSCVFPNASDRAGRTTRLTVMLGGDRAPQLLALSDQQLHAIVRDELTRLLGITRAPAVLTLRRATQCIPQMYVGHTARLERMRKHLNHWLNTPTPPPATPRPAPHTFGLPGGAIGLPPVTIGGTFVSGVSVNDCVRNGQQLAAQFYGMTIDRR